MKIFISHSAKGYDYETELYHPLQQSALALKHNFIFPHHQENTEISSKEHFKDTDLVIAEVSHPSTGGGIELGWANMMQVPILLLYKTGTKPASSLRFLEKATMLEYQDNEDMIEKITEHLKTRI